VKNLISILLIVGLVVIFGPIGKTADFDKNYVIHYSFDKDSGNTIKDLSGKNNNGTLINGVTLTKDGKFKNGIEFPGGNGYLETMVNVPEVNFTMALWIKTNSTNVGVCAVLEQAGGAGGHDRHFFLVGGNINFRVWQGGAWPTNAAVADGQWHHIALVTESGAGQTAYVDGKQVGTNAYDHSDFDWQDRMWVGFSNDAATQYFKGTIDEVVYLDVPLEAKDIEKLMNPGYPVDSLGKLTTNWGNIKTMY